MATESDRLLSPAIRSEDLDLYGSIEVSTKVPIDTQQPLKRASVDESRASSVLSFYKRHSRNFSAESGFETDYTRCSSIDFSENQQLIHLEETETKRKSALERIEIGIAEVEDELRKISTLDDNTAEDEGIDMTTTALSINNGDEDDFEFDNISIQSEFVSDQEERRQYTSVFGVLCNLKQAIQSLKSALEKECSRTWDEVEFCDDRELIGDNSMRHDGLKMRLDKCMGTVQEQMDLIRHKNDVIIDGVRSRRSVILRKKSPFDEVTWCHAFTFILVFSLLVGTIVYMYTWSHASNEWTVYMRLIRSPLLVVFLIFLYGINMKVWTMNGIDYIAVFNHHPNATPTPKYVFKVAALLILFMGIVVVGLVVSSPYSAKIPIIVVPLVLWGLLAVFLFNPCDVLLRKARINFFLVVIHILLAPLVFVYFSDFFLADQFNSDVALFLDVQYLMCYFVSNPMADVDASKCTSSSNWVRPIISFLPALWRLLQCLRCYYDTRNTKHLVNAVKYFTTFPVIVFATLFSTRIKGNITQNFNLSVDGWIVVSWFITSMIHAIYTFLWDVCCDWGLWDLRCSFMKRTLVYKYRCLYVMAIGVDFVLRFFWTLKLTLAITWQKDSDLMYTGKSLILGGSSWCSLRVVVYCGLQEWWNVGCVGPVKIR